MRIKDEKQEGIERRYVALSYITEKAAGPAAFLFLLKSVLCVILCVYAAGLCRAVDIYELEY